MGMHSPPFPQVTFWGVRGTLPVTGRGSLRYGGNTSCISVEFADGGLFIFDAGSGIKSFSDALKRAGRKHIKARIFISHPHIDHIQALPFFTPLFVQGNVFDVLGPAQQDKGMRELIAGQMDGVYFPVTLNEFAASVTYTNLEQGDYEFDGVRMRTLRLNHPGHCLGYRLECGGAVFCYVTDNELYPPDSPDYDEAYRQRLADFVRGADYLVTDTTYMDDEYADGKQHWGHSSVSEVVALAHRADIKTLCIFHHDPDQDDDAIDRKLAFARAQMAQLGSSTRVIAPAAGDQLDLSPT
ncbi:MBL fold metallo-hydrolase [Oceanococcus atlanticus]|nr:MBL fold metallo-hydrolase [Oceanococcus atlanticus]RZO87063.1 MAG: MBL fold metallo-hydrolase [Oceanococcus sp.]